MNKLIKIIGIGVPLLVLALIAMIALMMVMDRRIDYHVELGDTVVPAFDELVIPFDQKLDESQSLPFMASAIIDVDNDGTEELFLGGGPNQNDALFKFENNRFVEMTESAGWSKSAIGEATFGSSVIDVDKNGYSDMIISRTNGVWLYLNQGGKFTEQPLDLPIQDDTTPLSVAVGDINRDGHFDMYVAGYIDKELTQGQNNFTPDYGGTSLMVLNNGDNTFSDITSDSGLYYKHNTFMGIFIDVDNDGFEDLVVAHDTGHVKTWKNKGDQTFEDIPNPDSVRYSYPMGIGVTDYGNDGLVDFFFSNVGSTPPTFMVKGNLADEQTFNSKWMFFKNQGNFRFDDISNEVKIADYEFSWGGIFEDFNLDGRDDLVVSENYIGLPPHKVPLLRAPGRFLIQNQHGEFVASGKLSGVENKFYGISPITADFNLDGYPDLVHVNLAGRSKAFISNGGDANYLKVKLPDTVESIAAKITVVLDNGETLNRNFVSGEGLCSDQSHVQIFGLDRASATEVFVQYIDGKTDSRSVSIANQTIVFDE